MANREGGEYGADNAGNPGFIRFKRSAHRPARATERRTGFEGGSVNVPVKNIHPTLTYFTHQLGSSLSNLVVFVFGYVFQRGNFLHDCHSDIFRSASKWSKCCAISLTFSNFGVLVIREVQGGT
jgi:hypothetical protein